VELDRYRRIFSDDSISLLFSSRSPSRLSSGELPIKCVECSLPLHFPHFHSPKKEVEMSFPLSSHFNFSLSFFTLFSCFSLSPKNFSATFFCNPFFHFVMPFSVNFLSQTDKEGIILMSLNHKLFHFEFPLLQLKFHLFFNFLKVLRVFWVF
jgi:hypothetical protein